MKLPKSWTRVTPFSKALALALFILLPFLAFYFGMQYQKITTITSSVMQQASVTPAGERVDFTLADNGKTRYVHVGDELVFTFGENFTTHIQPQNNLVKTVSPNHFVTLGTGTSTFTGSITPVCKPHQICSHIVIMYTTTVIIK